MASPEARMGALVLKKTKLGEADVIVHLMAEDGSAVRAVAKGARKPKNANSATLELFNQVQVTIIPGRSLGIAKDARLMERADGLRADPARFAAASVVAEAADAAIQPDLPADRLFAMTCAAISCASDAPEDALPLLVAAYAFKQTALLGMRPSFSSCAICGERVEEKGGQVRFSFADGGAVCRACAVATETASADTRAVSLSDALVRSTFADIVRMQPQSAAWDAAELAHSWIRHHLGARMRSFASFKAICGCSHVQAGV